MPVLGGDDPAVRSVVVVRVLPGLGDLLCAVPALRTLRAAGPKAHVAMVVDPVARPMAARLGHYVDELIDFGGFPGIAESPTTDAAAMVEAIERLQRRRFDLAIQLHGNGSLSNAYTLLLGATRTAGCYVEGTPPPDPHTFVPFAADEPEVRRNLRIVTNLGAVAMGEHLEFPVGDDDRAEGGRLLGEAVAPGQPYACIHPGASVPERRWPAVRFAAVADRLAERGVGVVVTGGAAERDVAADVIGRMHHAGVAIDVSGRTSLGGLAALLADASVVVTNDTGTSHLADAVGAPSVVIYVTADHRRWAPLDPRRHRRVAAEPPRLEPPPVEAVLAEVDVLLSPGERRPAAFRPPPSPTSPRRG